MASMWMRGDDGGRVEATVGDPTSRAAAGLGQGVSILRAGAEFGSPWVLIASYTTHVTANGEPVFTGARVLDSRDEIRCGQTLAVFADERIAHIEPLPSGALAAGAHSVRCARCTGDIARDSPAVRCPDPVCGAWHHQNESAALTCWTYAPHCAACGCATAIDSNGWEPEEF